MKRIILTLSLLLTLSLPSCRKEEIQPTPIVNLFIDEQPSSLVDSLGVTFFDNPLVSDVTPSTDATIQDYPLFLDYDPFTSITVRTNGIDSCVRGLEITKSQKEQLTRAFNSKIDCQKNNKLIIARIHREIESWAKIQKENYYKNWYLIEKGKLTDSLKRGLLTESQYKEKLSSLEKTWASKMNYLNTQVKEKIKSNIERATASGKIKDCEKNWLISVLDILGKEKYKKWIECYKYHYRKK